MKEYRIKVNYSTGNSFGSEDTSDYLELTFKDLDVAKKNLTRIEEHYEMYRDLENHSPKRKAKEWYKQNQTKDWFVNKPKLWCISSDRVIDEKDKKKCGEGNWEYRPDTHYANYCLNLYTDEGNKLQISAFWGGYFETLYSVEIEQNLDDMKIYF